MTPSTEHWQLLVQGTVQGVGFRPCVYRIAIDLHLLGQVRNTELGVEICIQGHPRTLEYFQQRLLNELPPLARVETIQHRQIPSDPQLNDFCIAPSTGKTRRHALPDIPPDIAPCDDCLREMRDQRNRRFGYPFISCTNCGPRYSIIDSLPYDRPGTSMRAFTLCPQCQAEYDNPADRRYHAQPISCWDCGPQLRARTAAGRILAEQRSALELARTALAGGQILALRAIGGFQLLCDATSQNAVLRLRQRKGRPAKPFAILCARIEQAQQLAHINVHERELLRSPEAPIVLLDAKRAHGVCPAVAPGIHQLGIMLPATPLQQLIADELDIPLVATSANPSESPIIADFDDLVATIPNCFDLALDHDRHISNPIDDSVLMSLDDRILMIRRARGFAPRSITLPRPLQSAALALGAQQKCCIALAQQQRVLLSPHLGDILSAEDLDFLHRHRQRLQDIYQIEPERVLADQHPQYLNTQYALDSGLPCTRVQHHQAHVLAVMLEHGIDEPVLGISWDGTGYAEHSPVLRGGDILRSHLGQPSAEQLAFLRPLQLIGGEQAIREPRRSALAIAWDIHGSDWEQQCPQLARAFDPGERANLARLLQRAQGVASSSAGRLFDALAALTGQCLIRDYDAQPGLLLEALACDAQAPPLPWKLDQAQIDWRPAFAELIDLAAQAPSQAVDRFINTLVDIQLSFADRYALPIVLCGGVFQNRVLASRSLHALHRAGHRAWLPSQVPPNDAAIALGQIGALPDLQNPANTIITDL